MSWFIPVREVATGFLPESPVQRSAAGVRPWQPCYLPLLIALPSPPLYSDRDRENASVREREGDYLFATEAENRTR